MTAHATVRSDTQILHELIRRHRQLYDSPDIDLRLERLIRAVPFPPLSSWDIHRLLRTSQSVFFDTHVQVVSGHHTATYLRFESIARTPELITIIARAMADWLYDTFKRQPITGIVATMSDAQRVASRVTELLRDRLPLRLVLTPFDWDTGKIGTDIDWGCINPGEWFVSMNDVTTRGMCVSKLGKVVTDHGGVLAGMMVFARRDSGQFPLMEELTATFPFYYSVDLDMPQWEPKDCPLCRRNLPLLSWKDIPQL